VASSPWPSYHHNDARPTFRTRITKDQTQVVLWVAGELDVTVAERMDDALSGACPAPGQRLTIDVSHLTFIDVSGARLLIDADRRWRDEGRSGLFVRGAATIVRRVFEILRATSLLEDWEGAGESVALLRPGTFRQAGPLELARQAAGLSILDLFVAYFALGGTAGLSQLAGHLAGDPYALDDHQQQVAIQAVDEYLIDREQTDQLLSPSSE
jgi:anti-anti-sigma factor